jgi:glutathione synthase/RimK-type ligase-like ATP-grasp enzyme
VRLSIIENLTQDNRYLHDAKRLVEEANIRGITANICDIRDFDRETLDKNDDIGEGIYTRHVMGLRTGALLAAKGYFNNKILMNSARFFDLHNGSKYYQQSMLAHSHLADHAIKTFCVDTGKEVLDLVSAKKLNFPIIVKPDTGSEGRRVHLLRSQADFKKVSDFSEMVAQPYIEFDYEWRVYVVGGVSYNAGRGENLFEQQRRETPMWADRFLETDQKINETLKRIAAEAVSLFGLEYSGVDIFREKATGKFYITEANTGSSIGLVSYSKNVHENIPREVVDWFIERDKWLNQKLPLSQCLDTYLGSRMGRLSEKTQEKVWEILGQVKKPAKKLTERQIQQDFFAIPLADKLEFLYDELRNEHEPAVTNMIFGEAEQSVSWAGNFLVDAREQTRTGVSAAHTLERGAIASALYIAAKNM